MKKGTEETLIGMAKQQGKGSHSTTNSYTDSLLEVNWDDAWWNDSQGSQVVQTRQTSRTPTSRYHQEVDKHRHTRESGAGNG